MYTSTKMAIFTFCIMALLLSVTAGFFDKREDASTFFTQGRYGRAGGGNGERQKQVTPRSNKFFLGTRFGKRSNTFQPNASLFYPTSLCSERDDLSCDYTGVSNLYRCIQRKSENIADYVTSN